MGESRKSGCPQHLVLRPGGDKILAIFCDIERNSGQPGKKGRGKQVDER